MQIILLKVRRSEELRCLAGKRRVGFRSHEFQEIIAGETLLFESRFEKASGQVKFCLCVFRLKHQHRFKRLDRFRDVLPLFDGIVAGEVATQGVVRRHRVRQTGALLSASQLRGRFGQLAGTHGLPAGEDRFHLGDHHLIQLLARRAQVKIVTRSSFSDFLP